MSAVLPIATAYLVCGRATSAWITHSLICPRDADVRAWLRRHR